MKEWRKILSLASYYSGLSGQKSLWELADLTLNVQERWGKHPQYNLKSLSN